MLGDIREDLVASFLLRKSSLSEAQLDTILAANISVDLSERVKLRESGRVSKGAFVRSLRQGQNNVEGSIYTLFLLAYLNLISPEFGSQLTRTINMLTRVKSAKAEKNALLELIDAMQDFTERVSRRRKFIL